MAEDLPDSMFFAGSEPDQLEKELKLELLDVTDIKYECTGEESNSIKVPSNQSVVNDKKINMNPIVLLDRVSQETISLYTRPLKAVKSESQRSSSKVATSRPQNSSKKTNKKTKTAVNIVATKRKLKKSVVKRIGGQARGTASSDIVVKRPAKKSKKPEQPCNCPECGKTFTRISNMNMHKFVVHSGIKPYICQECQKAFRRVDNLRRHLNVHTGERPFACGVCDKRFGDQHNAIRHESNHWRPFRNTKMGRKRRTVIPVHRCEKCCMEFKRPYALKVHMRLHTGERPYKCQDCDRCFRVLAELKHHMLVTHVRPKFGLYKYQCGMCDMKYQRMGALRDHLGTHCGETEFTCGTCGKIFSGLDLLSEHLPEHISVKLLSCPACGARFAKRYHLKQHMMRNQTCCLQTCGQHSVKQYPCELCSKSFLKRKDLTEHVYTHTGILRYPCGQCGARFMHAYQRRNHMLTHDRKKHVCELCGKAFLKRDQLTEHMARHSGIRHQLCFQCGASFMRPHQLRDHMEKYHDLDATSPPSAPPSDSADPVVNDSKTVVNAALSGSGYTCETCGKWFRLKSRLNVHLPLHSTAKTHVCDLCSRGYKRQRDLLKHTKFRCKYRELKASLLSTAASELLD